MTGKQLRNSILQWAIQGKLVPQDPKDEPASVLLERIRAEKARLVKEKKIKKDKNESVIFRGEDNSYYEKMADGTVRCIDSEIPFDIPDTWAWCRLQYVVQLNPKNKAEDNILAGFIPMEKIEATYLSAFDFIERKWREIKNGFTHFSDGDVAFAKITPCFQNRKSMILKNLPNGIGAGTTELKVLRAYGSTILAEYLLYFLESAYFVEEATFKGTANQQRIISGYLENKLFPLPPIAEQLRITAKIAELLTICDRFIKSQDALDKLNIQINANLRKSILQEAIQGRLVPQIETEGTAEELLSEIRSEKLRLVNEGKLKKSGLNNESRIFRGEDNRYYEQIGSNTCDITDSIPFEIPDNWIWVRGRTVFLPMESTKPSMEMFTYIDLDAVDNKANVISKSKQVAKSNAPSRATRKLHKNDILFSMVRPYLRNIALVTSNYANAIASTGFYVITPSCSILPGYLFHMMLSSYVVDGLNKYMKGDNSPSINNSHIELFLYPLPPLKEQERIECRINELFKTLK